MTKSEFIELLLRQEVLTFGSFQTKSGRKSPFFFNTGKFDSGAVIKQVAAAYAEHIVREFGRDVHFLFGPAYKGIPLCVAVAEQLAERVGHDVFFSFNRKEAKDHGEGGWLVGKKYLGNENVLIIEDVLTGGTSVRKSLSLLRPLGISIQGVMLGIDRQERGIRGDLCAAKELATELGVKVTSLVTLDDVVAHLHNRQVLGKVWIDDGIFAEINRYRMNYRGESCP